MRIGITGGLGVIGQALSKALNMKNIDFVFFDTGSCNWKIINLLKLIDILE